MSDPNARPDNPFASPQFTPQPPPKPGKDVEIAAIDRLKRAKALLGDQYWLFVGITFVALLIGGLVPLGILMGPLICGLFLCYRQRMVGQQASFDPLFKGFECFAESLKAILIYVGIAMLCMLPVMIVYFVGFIGIMAGAGTTDSPAMLFLFIPLYLIFYALILLVSAVAYTPFTFAFPLIVDRGMNGVEAVKLSWATAKPIYFKLVKMYFIYSLIGLVCAMCCIVPFYLFIPIVIGAVFTLYQDFFGLNPAAPQ